MILSGYLLAASFFGIFEVVQEWDFNHEPAVKEWHANAHLADVSVKEGVLHAYAVDWDPFFTCSTVSLAATPEQCVLIQIKTDTSGSCQLFWTGDLTGEHSGFSQEKVTDFKITAAPDYQDIYLFPFWHAEGNIRQLRLDLYEGGNFAIKRIALLKRDRVQKFSTPGSWEIKSPSDNSDWLSLNHGTLLSGPPMAISTEDAGWVSLTLKSEKDTTLAMEWAATSMRGSHRENIHVQRSETPRHYYVEMQGDRNWTGKLVGLTLHIPEPTKVSIERIALTVEPNGPPDIIVHYFGFENGVSRMGRPESILMILKNQGGGEVTIKTAPLEVPAGLELLSPPELEGPSQLRHGDNMAIRWRVKAERADTFTVALQLTDPVLRCETALTFLPAVEYTVQYVPKPKPIKTGVEICAYYFPGWNSSVKYDCLRYAAPVRKPILGYYDESNPECVDWQIKWAVENGIHCFLVDWYWVAGKQSLCHWFEAYGKARYRDYLKVAIMWANHNPAGTHSRTDWRNVTQEWIDTYFSLPGYYKINGKPAVFLWDSTLIRSDLGGSESVAEAFEESQEMACNAGYDGIEFIILQNHVSQHDIAQYQQEGYGGNTSYHEFGRALDRAPHNSQARYADIVATAPDAWEQRRQLSTSLPYYPLIDTGWNSHPWHGVNAMAFHKRTAADFKLLLTAAKDYGNTHTQNIFILGPLNEWGEGSYIEPNLEFGFDMYEAIRNVFGKGDPKTWPANLTPRDMGLGPYDFPKMPKTVIWRFEQNTEGWTAIMNITNLAVTEGIMHFQSTSHDPALMVSTQQIRASEYTLLKIRMKVMTTGSENVHGRIFWSYNDRNTSEATSCPFPVQADGIFHNYTLQLNEHPRWRGRINRLRFDPCDINGAQVFIDHIEFN